MANILHLDRQVAVVAHLVDGASVRATERLTGVARNTILDLLVRVGLGRLLLHDRLVRDLASSIIEADELFAFIQKKEGRKTKRDPESFGDADSFVALCATSRLIISHVTGKRTPENTDGFMADLRARVVGRPQLSTDGFGCYPDAVRKAFGYHGVDYGVVIKEYEKSIANQMAAAHRYSPGRVKSMRKVSVFGNPDEELINTSHSERANLTFRMGQRRFTRLTNGFSKKMENHLAAVALHIVHYNFVRVHMTLKTTPAVQAGLAPRPWSIHEMVIAALHAADEQGTPDPTGGAPVAPPPPPPASWVEGDMEVCQAMHGSAPANDVQVEEEDAPDTVREPMAFDAAGQG